MGSEMILVVDDEPHIRRVLSFALQGHGFRVITAADGREGFEMYRANPAIEFLITDYVMPGLDGLAMCRKLELKGGERRVPVLLLTSYDFRTTFEQLIEAGVDYVLNKPFSPRKIVKLVQDILDDRKGIMPQGEMAISISGLGSDLRSVAGDF